MKMINKATAERAIESLPSGEQEAYRKRLDQCITVEEVLALHQEVLRKIKVSGNIQHKGNRPFSQK